MIIANNNNRLNRDVYSEFVRGYDCTAYNFMIILSKV